MLIDTIKADWKAARLSRDNLKATVLGTLVGAIQSKEKTFNPERSLTDEEVILQVKKMLDGLYETKKIIKDIPERFRELVKTEEEILILSVYMPQKLSETELENILREKVSAGMKDMKSLMATLKENYFGRYDGKVASDLIKKVLM